MHSIDCMRLLFGNTTLELLGMADCQRKWKNRWVTKIALRHRSISDFEHTSPLYECLFHFLSLRAREKGLDVRLLFPNPETVPSEIVQVRIRNPVNLVGACYQRVIETFYDQGLE